MKTTHDAIDERIKGILNEKQRLEKRKLEKKAEPIIKVCSMCKTNNSHYDVSAGIWICAFC